MDIITRKKVKLIKWLRVDQSILQHVQSRKLITMDEYTTLESVSDPGTQITELLNLMLQKGEHVCIDFLDLLKEDVVNESSPELKEWITSVITEEIKAAPQSSVQYSGSPVNILVSGDSSVCTPVICGYQDSDFNMSVRIGPQKKTGGKPQISYEIKAAPQSSVQYSGSPVNIMATNNSNVWSPIVISSPISDLNMTVSIDGQTKN